MMKLGVGLKWGAIATLVLGVGLISFYVIQFIQEGERDKITIEIQERQIEKVREVNEVVGTPSSSRDDVRSDADSVLRVWESRQAD